MGATEILAANANGGLERLLTSNDIAIYTLATCLCLALVGNVVQYFVGNYRQGKDFERFQNITTAMNAMAVAVNNLGGAVREMEKIFDFVAKLYKSGDDKEDNHVSEKNSG